jgi:uncharacterized protein with von Willebrand factor type A (vWA) domain
MSLLGNLLTKAQSFFGSQPTPKPFTDAVAQDNFDHDVFQRCVDEIAPLRHMVEKLAVKNGHVDTIVRDAMQLFWQSSPQLHDVKQMAEASLRSHAVATDINTAPDTERLRGMTRLDEYGSVMAILSVAERIEKFLSDHDKLAEDAEKAEQAQKGADNAAQAVQEALEACAGGFDGIGPQTAAEATAQAVLDAVLAQAEATQDALVEARDAVVQTAEKIAGAMDHEIRQAITEVSDKLDEEMQMFRAWGMTDGEIKKLSFEERMKLAALLRGSRLAKFAKLIGRRRLAAAAMRTKRTEYGRDEVVGTEMSGDLPRVLEGEFAKGRLGRLMRLQFLQDFAENQLLSRKFIGVERVQQGAIIVCEDESGSMTMLDGNGITREAWAKATGLCLLDQAKHEKRDFVWIGFSTANQVKAWYFPKGEGSIYQVMECVEHFFNGGTDFMAPLGHAVSILNNEFEQIKSLKGDIVFLTDDDCRVTPAWLLAFNEAKAKLNFRVFGIFCGVPERPGSHLALLSDNIRSATDFSDPNDLADMIRVI